MERGQGFDLLITGGTVLTMVAGEPPLVDGAVAVRGGEIVAVGGAVELRAAAAGARVLDAGGGIILPGFVNTHTHLAMTLLRGYADDLPLQQWLQEHIWPAEARLVTPETVVVGTRLALVESVRAGVTCVVDMYFFAERIAEVLVAAGVRGIVGESMVDFPLPWAGTPEDTLVRQREALARTRGQSLVQVAVAPHAPYSVGPVNLVREAELAEEFNAPLVIHLAETRWELEKIERERGMSPVAYLADLGILSDRTVAAHCVHVSPADLDTLAEFGVGVASNPASNLKLASGVAPVPEMLRRGVRVSLGTDGAASNNTLDLLRDAQLAALMYKGVTGDPTVMNARTVVELLTRRGAEALGLAEVIGSLTPGRRADVICIDTGEAHAVPMFDPYSHLAYAARAADVRHVVVDGRLLMEDRQMLSLDAGAALSEARAVAARLLAAS